jgi:hypothetical protein
LFRWQQRECRLERVQAEAAPRWNGQLATTDLKEIPYAVLTGALAANLFNRDPQVE